jgi:hypothetical protein
VQTHQNNHARILALRAATSALDGQIKATLSTLANTRKEITGITTTVYPDTPEYEVSYEELLSYARRISRTTLPPHDPMREVNVDGNKAGSGEATQPGSADQTAGHTPGSTSGMNGMATPGPASGAATGSALPTSVPTPAAGTSAPTPAVGTPAVDGQQAPPHLSVNGAPYNTIEPLEEPLQARLKPFSPDTFVPWPQDTSIRNGALALLHHLSDMGIDAKTYDPAAEKARLEAAEKERIEAEEAANKARAAHEARMAEERERMRLTRERERQKEEDVESWRRGSMVVVDGAEGGQNRDGGAGGGEKKQFQFLGGIDDDDDDDD